MIEKQDNPQCSSCGFVFYINPAPAIAVIIENDEQQILLTKRKHDPKKGYWDLPGGFIVPGEDIDTSAKRELKEELGVDIEVKKVVGFYTGEYIFQNVAYPVLDVAIVAKIIDGNPSPADDVAEYAFFPKEKAQQQQLAFSRVRRELEDYLVQCKK